MIRIWKLTPTNLEDSIWKKWSPEAIIVRAESEAEARHLAAVKTIKFLSAVPGALIDINPWSGHRWKGDPGPRPTLCEDITEQTTEYSVDGPTEVLHHGEKL